MIEAFRSPKIECFVANHQWLENDCLFADIILPVTCQLELEDLGFISPIVQERVAVFYQGQAIKPIGDSKSDYEIACEIARKLGVHEQYTQGLTVEEWIKRAYQKSGIQDIISLEASIQPLFFPVNTTVRYHRHTNSELRLHIF